MSVIFRIKSWRYTSPSQLMVTLRNAWSYFYFILILTSTSSNRVYSNMYLQQLYISFRFLNLSNSHKKHEVREIIYLFFMICFSYFVFASFIIIKTLLLQESLQMSNLQLTGHTGQVLTLVYNNSTTYLASSGMDKQILIWSCRSSYDNVLNLKSHTNAITTLAWTHTDRLISGSADKSLCNWDIQTAKVIRKYRGHNSIVQNVACPKKTRDLIASVADDGSLRVWQQRSKQELKIWQGKYPLTSVSFSLNGDKVYMGGIDNDIKCYNIAQGKIQDVIEGHQDTVSSLQVSHDGSYLMSNSFDETIRIWDIRSGVLKGKRLAKTMSGHSQGSQKTLIRGCWSKDGLYIACGSIDKCVYIWDTTTRKIVQRLGGHTGSVTQVSMGQGNYLASGSNDRSIIVSQLPDIFL